MATLAEQISAGDVEEPSEGTLAEMIKGEKAPPVAEKPVVKKPAAVKKPPEATIQAEYESYNIPMVTGDIEVDKKLAGIVPLPIPGGVGVIGEPREKVYPYEYIPEAAETALSTMKGVGAFVTGAAGLPMLWNLIIAKAAGLSTEEALEEAERAGGWYAKGAPPEGPIAETVAKAFELPRKGAEALAEAAVPYEMKPEDVRFGPEVDRWVRDLGRTAVGTLTELGIFAVAGLGARAGWRGLKRTARRKIEPEITPINIKEALEKVDTKGDPAAEVAVEEGLKLIRREIEVYKPGKPVGPKALEEVVEKPKPREVVEPRIEEVPDFTKLGKERGISPTEAAVKWGEKASPEEIKLVKTKNAELIEEAVRLRKEAEVLPQGGPEQKAKYEKAVDIGFKSQFTREAIEGSEGRHPTQVEAKIVPPTRETTAFVETIKKEMEIGDRNVEIVPITRGIAGSRFIESTEHPSGRATHQILIRTDKSAADVKQQIIHELGHIKYGPRTSEAFWREVDPLLEKHRVLEPGLGVRPPPKPTITPETLRENPDLYREVLDKREAFPKSTVKAAENIEAYIKTQVVLHDDVRGEWTGKKKTVPEISRDLKLTEKEVVDILETEGVLGSPKETTLTKVTDRARREVKKIADMRLAPEESGRLLDAYFDKLENTLADRYRTSFPDAGEKAAVLDYVSSFRDLIDERMGERAPTGVLGERPEEIPGLTVRGPEGEVTLEAGIEQSLYEAVAKRFSDRIRKRRRAKEPTTKEAVERIEKARTYLTYRDLQELRERAYDKRFNTEDITELAEEMFGKKSLAELTVEEADVLGLRILEADSIPRLEGVKLVRAAKDVSSKTKRRLEKFVRLRDVDELEFKDYLDLRTLEGAITEEAVSNVIKDIRLVNSVRPSDGKLVFATLAPIKRILGEKFVAPWRAAELAYLENHAPYVRRVSDAFSELNRKAREAITHHREGRVPREQLSPEMRRASDSLTTLYDELWEALNMKDYFKEGDLAKVKDYSPRREAGREDMINWAFSRRGMKEFDFWAEHKRTGELWPTELDAKANALAYIRGGFRTRYFREAAKAAGYDVNEKGRLVPARGPVIDLDPQRQAFAGRWLDTVIRRIPSKDEQVMDAAGRAVIRSYNRFAKRLFEKAQIPLKGNERIFRSFVSTMLDLNYSSFMGLRPKLGLRNLTQQWLIVNEYGLGAYTRGRARLHSTEVKAAMEKSTVVRLREQQYAVFEEHLNKFTDVPARTRHLLMRLYRLSDRNNVRVAFSTGFSKARARGLDEAKAIRAGNEAVHNTQWGYGIDLPYFFRTPTGRLAGQYNSWFIWYADHVTRMVKEQHGAKMARMLVQGTVLYYVAERYGIDYTRTFMFGVVPDAFGYGVQTATDIIKFFKAIGTMNVDKIWGAGKAVAEAGLGFVPASLFARDILEAERKGTLKPLLTYEKKRPGGRRARVRRGD